MTARGAGAAGLGSLLCPAFGPGSYRLATPVAGLFIAQTGLFGHGPENGARYRPQDIRT